jgi:hypothetical protein
MNKKQLIVLWIWISLMVIMGLFPPASRVSSDRPMYAYNNWFDGLVYTWIGHKFILNVDYIDFTKLIIPWIIVTVIAIGLFLPFKTKRKTDI